MTTYRKFWTSGVTGELALHRVVSPDGIRSRRWTVERHDGTVIQQLSSGVSARTARTWTSVGAAVHGDGTRGPSIRSEMFVDMLDAFISPGSSAAVIRVFWVKESGMRVQYRVRGSGGTRGSYYFEKNVGNETDTSQTSLSGSPDSWALQFTVSHSSGQTLANVSSEVAVNMIDALVFG